MKAATKSRPPRESQIVDAIGRRLHKEPGCVFRKRHGTAYGYAGDPDLYGSLRGRHFEIEVKRPGEAPSDLQRARLREWNDSNAMTGAATSVAEACAILSIPVVPQ